jgi:hypothetical protein
MLIERPTQTASPDVLDQRFHAIVMGVRNESAVVLAASRFDADSGAAPEETECRIALHPTLPLAVAISGLRQLRDPRSGRSIDTIEMTRRVVEDVGQANDLELGRLSTRLANRLHPLVREALRSTGSTSDPLAGVTLLIGYVHGLAAGMGLVRLGQRVDARPLETYIEHPDTLRSVYSSGPDRDPSALFGLSLRDSTVVAHHLRRVLADGIAYEAAVVDRSNSGCGTHVDVVVVNARGARLVD